MSIGFKNYPGQTFIIKTVFYDSTYLVIKKKYALLGLEKSPNKISITLLTDIEKHFHFSPEKLGLKRTKGSNNMHEKFEKIP